MPTTYYEWDELDDNIVAEYDDNGSTIVDYTQEPGIHGRLISEDRGGVSSQYHFDGQGNTLALTDDTQQITDMFAYSAFGEQTERSGATPTPLQFGGEHGYYKDELTGDCNVRRRDYGPRLGRWKSVDPIHLKLAAVFVERIYAGLQAQHYDYAQNNPLRYVDPSGLLHKSIENEGCSEKELGNIADAVESACDFVNRRSALCLPKTLKECLASICAGNILTKCIKECDKAKGHHVTCAVSKATKDEKTFSDLEVTKLCESSLPKETTPVIVICQSVKGARGGISNPRNCYGAPEDAMQVIFHELIHFCGSKHKFDAADRPIFEGDLVFACMRSCFSVGAGESGECRCGCD
jgi:RHS repeat-associated protein